MRAWPLCLLVAGCFQGVATVAKPTALELQLIGAYRNLDEDLVRSASVRATNGPSFETLAMDAIEARALQRFNEDDVLLLKGEGCLAETLAAKIVARDCASISDPTVARRRERILQEENRCRATILGWAAHELARREGRPEPSAAELEMLRQAYVRLVRDAALPGHWVEAEPGRFEPVPPS